MWNNMFRTNFGSLWNQQRGYGTHSNNLFPEHTKMKTDTASLTGPLIGINLSQIVDSKKFSNPNYVNKQNIQLNKCQVDGLANYKIGSKIVENCNQFFPPPSQEEPLVSKPIEAEKNAITNHVPNIEETPKNVDLKSEPISIKPSSFATKEIKSESYKETMCKKSPDMGKKHSKSYDIERHKLPRRSKVLAVDTENIYLTDLKDSRAAKNRIVKIPTKVQNSSKKYSKKSWNNFQKLKKNQKYFDWYDLRDNSSESEEDEDEDDDDEVTMQFPDDFKVVRSEKLHMERDGDDLQFVIGPFYDKEGALSLMESVKPKQEAYTATDCTYNSSPKVGDACRDLLHKIACTPMTVKISGGAPKHTYVAKINATEICPSPDPPSPCLTNARCRGRTVSECSDDFIIFEGGDDDYNEDDEDTCDTDSCSDDCSTIADSDNDQWDDDDSVQFARSPCNDGDTCKNIYNKPKKVSFNKNNLCTIHPMVKWSYAYQAARKGPWEAYARDRSRFERRIKSSAKTLDKVLEPQHRNMIYESRFCSKE